jgi:hypothetical protein
LQVRHPIGSFRAAKVTLFFESTLKGSGFYRNFFLINGYKCKWYRCRSTK